MYGQKHGLLINNTPPNNFVCHFHKFSIQRDDFDVLAKEELLCGILIHRGRLCHFPLMNIKPYTSKFSTDISQHE
jgi:hypothetical protein